jgi:lipoprotein-anchoring transpeptidase ErfK/SrfK
VKRRIAIGLAAAVLFALIAGVSVGGVDVGGMSATQAREKLSRELAPQLERTVVLDYRGRKFFLGPAYGHVRADVDGMVDGALTRSRDGTFVGRAIRELTGGTVRAQLPALVKYSNATLSDLVERVRRKINRPPQDAAVHPSGVGLGLRPAQDGLAVRARVLRRAIVSQLARPDSPHFVHVQAIPKKPKVTTEKLASEYPYFITISRAQFRLRLWRRLKLAKTYVIAVGQVGYATPAGLYHIQNKAINPSWHVPRSPWAGSLAGRVIPPGPDNPIKSRWMGIFDGAGIHGTAETYSLGHSASHGCIRMAIADVEELYDLVPVKTPVYIE